MPVRIPPSRENLKRKSVLRKGNDRSSFNTDVLNLCVFLLPMVITLVVTVAARNSEVQMGGAELQQEVEEEQTVFGSPVDQSDEEDYEQEDLGDDDEEDCEQEGLGDNDEEDCEQDLCGVDEDAPEKRANETITDARKPFAAESSGSQRTVLEIQAELSETLSGLWERIREYEARETLLAKEDEPDLELSKEEFETYFLDAAHLCVKFTRLALKLEALDPELGHERKQNGVEMLKALVAQREDFKARVPYLYKQ